MAWPATGIGAPNLDTTPGVAVPTSLTSITTLQAWLLGISIKNNDSLDRTVIVTDTAGGKLYEQLLSPGASAEFEWAFKPALGVKWVADGINVAGHVWGYV